MDVNLEIFDVKLKELEDMSKGDTLGYYKLYICENSSKSAIISKLYDVFNNVNPFKIDKLFIELMEKHELNKYMDEEAYGDNGIIILKITTDNYKIIVDKTRKFVRELLEQCYTFDKKRTKMILPLEIKISYKVNKDQGVYEE